MSARNRVLIAIVALAVVAAGVWIYLLVFTRCCAPPPVLPR
jgi:hypothetical protein